MNQVHDASCAWFLCLKRHSRRHELFGGNASSRRPFRRFFPRPADSRLATARPGLVWKSCGLTHGPGLVVGLAMVPLQEPAWWGDATPISFWIDQPIYDVMTWNLYKLVRFTLAPSPQSVQFMKIQFCSSVLQSHRVDWYWSFGALSWGDSFYNSIRTWNETRYCDDWTPISVCFMIFHHVEELTTKFN